MTAGRRVDSQKKQWAFPEKNWNPPAEDINGNSQGGRVKVVGISGGMSKFEQKTWISRGFNAKKVNLTWVYNFYQEKPNTMRD